VSKPDLLMQMIESVHKYGVSPMYEYQTIWNSPRIVMITPGSRRYWIRLLCLQLLDRIEVLKS